MNSRQRFVAWCLVGVFITLGLNGWGMGARLSYAASPPAPPTHTLPADQVEPLKEDAEALNPPVPADAEAAEPAVEGTLNLPDLEPQLPAESGPEESSAEADEAWTDIDVESTGTETSPPKVTKQQQILMTADEHYLAGDRETAEVLYRQVKDAVWQVDPNSLRPLPITDPAELPPRWSRVLARSTSGVRTGTHSPYPRAARTAQRGIS